VPVVNIEGVQAGELNLTGPVLADIFQGKITKWNDAKIAADNSGVKLPETGIQVVHRSDGSGTTNAFTSYLTAVAPDVWKAGAAKDVPWPTGTGAKGSDGVTAAVKQTDGAIGYAELSFAKGGNVAVASLKNASGAFVAPSNDGVAAALTNSTIPDDLKVKVSYTPTSPKAYALSTVSWVIVAKKITDPAKLALVKSFIKYALTTGQNAASSLYYAPLPTSLADKGVASIATVASS